MTPADSILLDRHLQTGEAAAFTELVHRHLPVVHAAALRITGSRILAEEVGQSVFSALAARRAALPAGLPLIVWLHRTTRSTALNLLRSENRRRSRERDFAFLHGPYEDPRPCPWDRIAPVLDDVIHQLPDAERGLILRRFFSGESHTAIAGEMNLSPDAVRMRMNRALARMRGLLRRQGIHTSAPALALSLPAYAAPPVSAALAATTAAAALPSLIAAGALAFPTLVPAAVMTAKTTTLIAAVLLAAGTGFLMLRPEEPTQPASAATGKAAAPFPPPLPPGGISPQQNQTKPEEQRGMGQKVTEAEAMRREERKKVMRDQIREIMEMETRVNPPPTPEEVAQFLEQGGKTVETLGWAFTRTGNVDYLRQGLVKDPESVFLHFLAAAMRTDKNQQNPEASMLSQRSLRWLRDHQPDMHAAFLIDGGRPVPLASLEALNNANFDMIPEDLLKKQHEVFLMRVRGFSAEKAAAHSSSAQGYSLKSLMLTAAVLSQDPAAGLVSAQAVSKAGGLEAEFVGLSQERVRYATADEGKLRELVGDSRENLLAAVDKEMKEVRELMDLHGEMVKSGTPDQVEELRKLTAEMGERAALEQLRNRRDTAGRPSPRTP